MSLSTRIKNTLVDKVNTCFAKIGAASGTAMPSSTDNREPIAYELWLAHHLATLANKRKERAEQEAVRAGVLFDKEKEPKLPGTKEVIYNGDLVSVSVEVRNPSTRVNADKLLDYLTIKGVDRVLLAKAEEAATTQTRPAHVFTTMLITDNGK